jgi:hypothetical protein
LRIRHDATDIDSISTLANRPDLGSKRAAVAIQRVTTEAGELSPDQHFCFVTGECSQNILGRRRRGLRERRARDARAPEARNY